MDSMIRFVLPSFDFVRMVCRRKVVIMYPVQGPLIEVTSRDCDEFRHVEMQGLSFIDG
jgi:hypothetical protein